MADQFLISRQKIPLAKYPKPLRLLWHLDIPEDLNELSLDYHLQVDHHINPHSALQDLGVVILYISLVDKCFKETHTSDSSQAFTHPSNWIQDKAVSKNWFHYFSFPVLPVFCQGQARKWGLFLRRPEIPSVQLDSRNTRNCIRKFCPTQFQTDSRQVRDSRWAGVKCLDPQALIWTSGMRGFKPYLSLVMMRNHRPMGRTRVVKPLARGSKSSVPLNLWTPGCSFSVSTTKIWAPIQPALKPVRGPGHGL